VASPLSHRIGWAFFVFHLRVGTRLALRLLIPVLSALFFFFYVLRPEFFYSLIDACFRLGFPVPGIVSTLIGIGTAAMAAPRIRPGFDGWLRHLPGKSSLQRRLMAAAVGIAQVPILFVLAALVLAASRQTEFPAAAYICGLPFLGLASAYSVLPSRKHKATKMLAAASCVLVTSANWVGLPAGFLLTVAADVVSGPVYSSRKRHRLRRHLPASLFLLGISWRALTLRLILAYLKPLLILGLTSIFLKNNVMDQALARAAVRFGGGLSLAMACGYLAAKLALRRPPWPWARSLPWSAARRACQDAEFLFLAMVPALIPIGLLSPQALGPLCAALPALTLHAAASMRSRDSSRGGVARKILIESSLGVILISLIPWSAGLLLAATPIFFGLAARAERLQKVSRWDELRHLAAGDPLAWSS